MAEEWKKIDGFPDYMVSSEGRVCSMKREQPIILKASKNTRGYLQVTLFDENKTSYGKTAHRLTHRLVASAFIQNTENKQQINHRNGCKTNNNVDNLEWSSSSENICHAFATGLQSRLGIKNSRTHLTEAQVLEIYKLAHAGMLQQTEIGKLFGISRVEVSHIKQGVSWRHVTKDIILKSERKINQTNMC